MDTIANITNTDVNHEKQEEITGEFVKQSEDNEMLIMATENSLHNDLKFVKEQVYDQCGLILTNIKLNLESVEYGACSFELDGQKIEHRVSKITPTKAGQLVTIWKRNKKGITVPFDTLDDIDFVIITSKSGDNIGQFIFPKSVLAYKGIISRNGIDGKRGIRVYPTWEKTTNKQAEKTQSWQTKYFVTIKSDNITDLELLRKLFDEVLDATLVIPYTYTDGKKLKNESSRFDFGKI